MAVILSLITLVVVVSALVDLIMRDESQIKHLPKFGWIIIVILLPLIGSVLWFGIGREHQQQRSDRGSFGDPQRWAREEVQQPQRSHAGPSDTELQLARLDAEIAEAERLDRIRRLEREVQERRDGGPEHRLSP